MGFEVQALGLRVQGLGAVLPLRANIYERQMLTKPIESPSV